jgi:hypothetical protein
MSTLVELQEVRESPVAQPLNEAVWKAWVRKGRANDRQSSAAHVKAVAWVSIAALIAAALLWSHLTSTYEVVVRFIVTAGALMVTFHAFRARDYAFAAVFGALALLYNPVAPVFGFSGDWQRALVVASAIPFFTSFVWRSMRPAHNA